MTAIIGQLTRKNHVFLMCRALKIKSTLRELKMTVFPDRRLSMNWSDVYIWIYGILRLPSKE